MKKVYLQLWEESEIGSGVTEDGCSLHLDEDQSKKFIKSIYKEREEQDVPNSYERINGEILEVKVSNSLFKEISKTKLGLRLPQHSFTNLKNLGEIKFIYDDNFHY